MRRIVLVGPPGAGKSTLVKLAKGKGINAIDIEDIHNKKRLEFIHLKDEEGKRLLSEAMDKIINELVEDAKDEVTIFGAGSYGSRFPEEKIEKVLILPPKDVYLKRFLRRDQSDPDKLVEAQDGELVYDYFVELVKNGDKRYDRIIKGVATPDQILERILNG